MGEFFHGWRRKVGGAALVLALVFMAGWVRSLKNLESVQLTRTKGLTRSYVRHAIISVDGKLGVFRVHHSSLPQMGFEWISLPFSAVYGSRAVDAATIFNVNGNGNVFLGHWQFIGVDCGKSASTFDPMIHTCFLLVPYWLIIFPLTAISAWLLLTGRPRLSTLGMTHKFYSQL